MLRGSQLATALRRQRAIFPMIGHMKKSLRKLHLLKVLFGISVCASLSLGGCLIHHCHMCEWHAISFPETNLRGEHDQAGLASVPSIQPQNNSHPLSLSGSGQCTRHTTRKQLSPALTVRVWPVYPAYNHKTTLTRSHCQGLASVPSIQPQNNSHPLSLSGSGQCIPSIQPQNNSHPLSLSGSGQCTKHTTTKQLSPALTVRVWPVYPAYNQKTTLTRSHCQGLASVPSIQPQNNSHPLSLSGSGQCTKHTTTKQLSPALTVRVRPVYPAYNHKTTLTALTVRVWPVYPAYNHKTTLTRSHCEGLASVPSIQPQNNSHPLSLSGSGQCTKHTTRKQFPTAVLVRDSGMCT